MRRTHVFTFLAAVLLLAGCRPRSVTIEERPLVKRNLTSFSFDASIDSIRVAIAEARGEKWQDSQSAYQGATLVWKNAKSPVDNPTNKEALHLQDAFLFGMGNAVGTSQVYFKNGKGLTYYADFQIHLIPTSSSNTLVEVFTHGSHVLAGTEWHPFARAGIYVTVDATSIEEYQILLDIGKQLGAASMPKILLPEPTLPSRKIIRQRML